MNISDRLFALADGKYRDFTASLIPTVDKNTVIGVRTPLIRGLAKEMKRAGQSREFLDALPHKYHEENNLHGFIINDISDFCECVSEVERFLPYVNNWATCDSLRPKAFARNTDNLYPFINKWLTSVKPYTVRFGIEMLMCYYLDEKFRHEYAEQVAKVQSGEYYVKMMQAWYFATALAKQWDETIGFLEEKRLSPWVHNKAVQKATESYRVSEEQKAYLRTLRI